jgi:hypothetical protein
MPSLSQAQSRLMHVAATPKCRSRTSNPPSLKVAREFVTADVGKKVGNLPDHVKPSRIKTIRRKAAKV